MLLEEYIIVKRKSKLNYKSNKIIKIIIDCKRDNYLHKKFDTKQKRINNIKINYSFLINILYKESLNIQTIKVCYTKHNYKNNKVSNVFVALQKKNKTIDLLVAINLAIKANKQTLLSI